MAGSLTMPDLTSIFDPVIQGTQELRSMRDALAEHNPALAEMIDAKLVEVARSIQEMWQPWIDLGDGRITTEEFHARRAALEAAEQERRRRHWETNLAYDEEMHIVAVECVHCCASYDWQMDPDLDNWPPTYFECIDVTGEDCQAEDEDFV